MMVSAIILQAEFKNWNTSPQTKTFQGGTSL
jgi:hypothetical protein